MRFAKLLFIAWLMGALGFPCPARAMASAMDAKSCGDAFSSAAAANSGSALDPIEGHTPAAQAKARLVGVSNTYDPFVVAKQNRVWPAEGYVQVEIDFNDGSPRRSKLLSYRDPMSGAQRSVPSMVVHDRSLGAVYKAYVDVLPEAVLREVQETEKEIPVARTLSYSLSSPDREGLRGFIRVFDGSAYAKAGTHPHEKFFSDPSLPLERLLQKQGRAVEAVRADRRAGFSSFEIGKVMIAKDAGMRERLAVRNMMVEWFKTHVLDQERENKTVFYADVESEAHREAYQRWFGFKVIEDPEQNGQVKPPAYLLRVDMKSLKQHLFPSAPAESIPKN